jgi:hypothetical protein
MPFRHYPPAVASLLANYLEKAMLTLKLIRGERLAADDTEARNQVIDGMLNAYDSGERHEERLIAAGLRRFSIFDWSMAAGEGDTDRKRRDLDGQAHS